MYHVSLLENSVRYQSIYLSKVLMPCSLWERPPRRWPQQKSLHLSLSKHSLLAFSSPHPLVAPLSLMYSLTLSFHLPSGLPLLPGPSISLTYTFFTHSSLFILSIWPNHLDVFPFYPFHHSTVHFTSSHTASFIHTFIALAFLSCHSTCPSQIAHFHTTHSWLLCPIPHTSFWSIRVCKRIQKSPTNWHGCIPRRSFHYRNVRCWTSYSHWILKK